MKTSMARRKKPSENSVDADEKERSAVATEWSRFLAQTKAQPQEQINRILTDQLGSSYSLTAEDFAQITTILRKPQKPE